ncbi:MAG: transporter substrate-binding domain-containing protein [Acutalibacteraceae bacterium]|nr:transporter substrate-binding domain-containing protein [Oscillospiraceae bacterium]
MKRISALIMCAVSALLLLSSCSEKDTFVIATDDSMQPFCYVDSLGNPVGFDIDIISEIAEDQGFEIKIMPVGYPDALESLEKGECDAVIAAVIPTDELCEKYDFSDMYYNNEYALAVRKGKNAGLIEMFNSGLSRLNESGRYKTLYQKYFGLN